MFHEYKIFADNALNVYISSFYLLEWQYKSYYC